MAKVYNEKTMPRKAGRASADPEASKVEELVPVPSAVGKDQESKNSDEGSHEESNVIRVTASALGSIGGDDQKAEVNKVSRKDSEMSSQRGNEHKSNDAESLNNDTNGNILRRSERNAKNNQSSYGAFGRRPFKYDDFEYGPGIGQKSNVDMNPPGSVTSNKRRRKASHMTAAPFPEGGMKRSMSAKTPSTHASLTSGDNSSPSYNQGRWTCYEHFKFLEALKKYGKEWQKVQQHVSTRTSTQARSHAQKFFVKLDKK